jgi:hypothetical protein
VPAISVRARALNNERASPTANRPRRYSDEENEIIEGGLALFGHFENHRKRRTASGVTPAVSNEVAMSKRGATFGRSDTTVRAGAEDVLAYLFLASAKCRWRDLDLERTTLSRENSHQIVSSCTEKGQRGDRVLVTKSVWKKVEGGVLTLTSVPAQHPSKPQAARFVRITPTVAVKIFAASTGMLLTRVSYVCRMDLSSSHLSTRPMLYVRGERTSREQKGARAAQRPTPTSDANNNRCRTTDANKRRQQASQDCLLVRSLSSRGTPTT